MYINTQIILKDTYCTTYVTFLESIIEENMEMCQRNEV